MAWSARVFVVLSVFALSCSHSGTRRPAASVYDNVRTPPESEIAGFFHNAGNGIDVEVGGDNSPGFITPLRPDEARVRTVPVYRMIELAEKTLDIEIYQMADYGFRRAVRAALARGVRVRVIKDPAPLGEKCVLFLPVRDKKKKVISYSLAAPNAVRVTQSGTKGEKRNRPDKDCKDQRRLAREILDHGGSFVPFNKPELCASGGTGCYEHGKLIIADGSRALVSTGNFNSSNLCVLEPNPNTGKGPDKCNRDYSYVLNAHVHPEDAEAIQVLNEVFERDLAQKRHDVADVLRSLGASKGGRRVTVSPYSTAPLADFIRSARESVWLENQYMKEPGLNDALLEVARRGVAVKMVLSSLCSFGKPKEPARGKAAAIFTAFDRAGVRTTFFTSRNVINGKPGYMHAKTIVVDARRAWVGSVNGSEVSTSNNREYGIFFDDRNEIAELLQRIKTDYVSPENETWQESLDCVKDKAEGLDPDSEDAE